jgi:predicted ATPase/class 3 adenylate cyclase/uncharacterized protein HemY
MPASLSEKIKSAAVEIVGERREVTVLFLDIANFTATAHLLDSEDIYLLTDEAMRLWTEAIYQYEGTVDKFIGDGLLALFGLPIAHENGPERAVRAALEMHRVIDPLQHRTKEAYGVEFRARIGVHTGLVIAGQMGNDLHMEYTVIGDTVNLAYRLQSAAEPGTVAVSFATYQRTRPFFKYKPLPAFQAKGKPEPVRAFQPVRLRTKPGQVRGLPGLQVPMIGRKDALDQLHDTLSDVLNHGYSRVALVTGEAGVGKSRLVTEFCQSLSQSDISYYQGTCMTYARAKPLWLLTNLIRDIAQISETDPARVQIQTLGAYLSQLGLKQDGALTYLSNVLGLVDGDPRLEPQLRHLDNTVLQKLTHAVLREMLLVEARLAPTVLVFEDLHWVDPASRDFLEYLLQSTDEVPLMLVLISRELERDTVLQPLMTAAATRSDPLVDILLKPLSPSEGQKLVGRFIKQTTPEAQALKRRIAERAEGNPFYAEEIVRMLIEQGGLIGTNGARQLTSQAFDLIEAVPGTLNGLILARFDRLAESERRILQKAAVTGTSFPTNLLTSLNGAEPETVVSQLGVLEERQFLICAPFGKQEGYAFRHALVQDVVYNTLLRRDRRKLHEQVAQAIEGSTFWPPDERTEAMAYHYGQSNNPVKAVPHLVAAGENAARRCAYETASKHFQRALALMQDESSDESDLRLRAQIGLGQSLKFVGAYREATNNLEEAFQRLLHRSLLVDSTSLLPMLVFGLRELADIRLRNSAPDEAVAHLEAGLAALGDEGAQMHPLLWRSLIERLAWVRFRQGKLDEAFTLASSATLGLDIAEGDDPLTLASLYNTLGGIFWRWGNLAEARTYVERSLEAYKSLGYAWGMAIAYTNVGVLHFAQGEWTKAVEYYERAYALRRENGYIPEQALNLNNLGQARLAMGDHAQAQQHLEASLDISQRLDDEFGIALAQIGLGHLAVIQSRFEEAAAYIEAALVLSEAAGDDQVIQAQWLWALIQAERGELRTALESGEQALQLARQAGLSEAEADCRRVLGTLQAQAGEVLEAEALLQEAMDLYLQVNAPHGQGLTSLELGCLYQSVADIDEPTYGEWQAKAQRALETAVERFEALGAVFDLQRARTALSQLTADTRSETRLEEQRIGLSEDNSIRNSRRELPTGEWRTAAIVWLELIPPPDADEEEVFETLALVIPALSLIAQEHQGRVIRRQDGLTVVFGAPTAYEDDTERAVHSAWDMARYLEQTPSFTFRLAVSQGEVVAGRIGSHVHHEFTVRGEPVQEAQRAAASVRTGSVWVTQEVQAATERVCIFQAAPSSGTVELADTILWELVDWREQPDPARGLPGLKAKLIGREAHVQAMTDLSKKMTQGIGGLIWIEGEPGIGKSRLMQEFTDAIQTVNCVLWDGRCSPQKSGQAFSLFSDLFAQAFNLQPSDTPAEIQTRIEQSTQTWPRDAQVTRPYLEALFGLQPGGLEGKRLGSLEPEQLRQQIFVALRRLFKSLASEQPIVLLLDDLHWIDPMSAEMLQFLIPMVTSVPILFVCAQRRQGADSPNDRLVRTQSLISTQTARLSLERLSPVESEVLLSELLPGSEIPGRLRDTIVERSEGNPYFIEEYVRVLIEQGYVQHVQEGWMIHPECDLDAIPLPSSLETLVRSRVDALPTDLKQLVQCAAVIGNSFEGSLLESISRLSSVRKGLARLESRLLVRRSEEGGRWEFSHSLIESVAYQAMLKARRKAVHLEVAQALELRWAGAEAQHAEELAFHFTQAGQADKALTYLALAGERAAAQFANEEAEGYFEQATQLLASGTQCAKEVHWRVLAGLGDVYRAMGRLAESKAALEEGLALVKNAGLADPQNAGIQRRLGETAQKRADLEAAYEHFGQALTILGQQGDDGSQAEVAHVLNRLAWIHFVRGQFEQARMACEASLTYARSVDSLSELASAENLLGGIHYRQCEWKAALHHTTRAMILREQMGYSWGVASTLGNLGVLAVSAGHWSKARSFFERSLALRQEIGDVEGISIAHNNLGTLARDQGDLNRAESHFNESLGIAIPFKIRFQAANSNVGLAQVFLLKGEINAAEEILAHSLDQAQEIGAEDLLVEVFRIQAEIWLTKSAWDKSLEAAQKSAALAAEIGNRSLEVAAWRVLSEIELQKGNFQASRDAIRQAKTALDEANDELEAGRVAAQAGRMYLLAAQVKQAETELKTAQEIFMRLGASLELKQVEKALRRPSSPEEEVEPELLSPPASHAPHNIHT